MGRSLKRQLHEGTIGRRRGERERERERERGRKREREREKEIERVGGGREKGGEFKSAEKADVIKLGRSLRSIGEFVYSVFVCLFACDLLTSSSATRLFRGPPPPPPKKKKKKKKKNNKKKKNKQTNNTTKQQQQQQQQKIILRAATQRKSGKTMTSVSAGYITLKLTQPLGSWLWSRDRTHGLLTRSCAPCPHLWIQTEKKTDGVKAPCPKTAGLKCRMRHSILQDGPLEGRK